MLELPKATANGLAARCWALSVATSCERYLSIEPHIKPISAVVFATFAKAGQATRLIGHVGLDPRTRRL